MGSSNKLSLNSGKTEIIIFKNKQQLITKHFNFRISGRKILPTDTVKCIWMNEWMNDRNPYLPSGKKVNIPKYKTVKAV